MYFENGNKFYNQGDFKFAIKEWGKSIENGKEIESCYYNIGCSYIKLKQYDDAIVSFRKAVSLQMTNKYFHNLGLCYIYKENYGSALFNLIIANRLDETDADTINAIKFVKNKIKGAGNEK